MRNVNSGYIGWSESKSSYVAKSVGIYPKTQFKKEYHISEKVFQEINNAGGFDTEWHHTSKYFNRTDFYKWNEKGISMIARKDFEKHLDTIISFCENAFEYGMVFSSWYSDLWEDAEPFMPLINLVCEYMLVEQDEEKEKAECERLYYANDEWTLAWAGHNLHAVSIVESLQNRLNNVLTLYFFPGDEYVSLDRSNGTLNVEIMTEDSWKEYVKKNYAKTYGTCGSIDINEYIRRGRVAKEWRRLSKRYKPEEKIHRHAVQFDNIWLSKKYKGEVQEYALQLYSYYNETLHI